MEIPWKHNVRTLERNGGCFVRFIGQAQAVMFSPTAISTINDLLTPSVIAVQCSERFEMACTYDVTAIEVGARITSHPHNSSLQLGWACESSHRNILHPPGLDMTTLFCKKIDDQVGFHVSGTETINSNSFWPPLQASQRPSCFKVRASEQTSVARLLPSNETAALDYFTY
jgi:hypothetical protein